MYFPMLHQDELLYSALARCRVHLGLDSQKELLRQHFSDPWVALPRICQTTWGSW